MSEFTSSTNSLGCFSTLCYTLLAKTKSQTEVRLTDFDCIKHVLLEYVSWMLLTYLVFYTFGQI